MPEQHYMAKYRECKNAFDFAADLEKIAKRFCTDSVRDVAVATAVSLHSRITLKTPVDTGRARANWFVAEGAPRIATTESVTAQKPPSLKGDSVIYITNSLPYIVPLEYGHSKQAPAGMVRLSIAEEMVEPLGGGGPAGRPA